MKGTSLLRIAVVCCIAVTFVVNFLWIVPLARTQQHGQVHVRLDNFAKPFHLAARPTIDEPIAKEFRAAGVNITSLPVDLVQSLSWKKLSALYGRDPVIIGQEHCPAFLSSTKHHYIGVAGPFNSGTNLLADLLQRNCQFPLDDSGEKDTGAVLWQVPWGKHGFSSSRDKRTAQRMEKINKTETLTVVVVRNPYDWMLSMCRNSYRIEYLNATGRCPFLIDESSGKPIAVSWWTTWNSILDFWNHWYEAYVEFSYPRLIVRLEDLTLRPKEVVAAICSCAGALPSLKFDYVITSSKAGMYHGEASEKTGFLEAWGRLGRAVPIDELQHREAGKLLNRSLMSLFRYQELPRAKSNAP